jgi:hypothetical protein
MNRVGRGEQHGSSPSARGSLLAFKLDFAAREQSGNYHPVEGAGNVELWSLGIGSVALTHEDIGFRSSPEGSPCFDTRPRLA